MSQEYLLDILMEGTEPITQKARRELPDDQIVKDLAITADSNPEQVMDLLSGTFAQEQERTRAAMVEAIRESLNRPTIEDVKRAIASSVRRLKMGLVRIEVQVNETEPVPIDGHTHERFEEAVELVQLGQPLGLIGPSGSGKTHMMGQVAQAIKAPRFRVSSMSGMTSAGDIVGRIMVVAGGITAYVGTGWTECFEHGGLWLGDEWDAVDPSVSLVINAANANGYIEIPQRGERIERHPDYRWAVSLNTYGRGANRMYVGRQAQDEAALDRFRVGQIEMDYDRKLEEQLCGDVPDLLKETWKLRDKVDELSLRRVVSTRFLINARTMVLGAKWTTEWCLRQCMIGWSEDELMRVGYSKEWMDTTYRTGRHGDQ